MGRCGRGAYLEATCVKGIGSSRSRVRGRVSETDEVSSFSFGLMLGYLLGCRVQTGDDPELESGGYSSSVLEGDGD